MADCIFCKIASGEIKSKRIYENEAFYSIYDLNPEVEGHALVISKKHFKTFLDVPNSLGSELMDAIKNTTLKLVKEHNAEGFNVINNGLNAGGQIIDHVHIHIIPRKKKDNFGWGNLINKCKKFKK